MSKRSKAAEGAFLSVYKRLIDLPGETDRQTDTVVLVAKTPAV